jgi:3-polyprenyl-4-hydroxybenzoate decarboxylase
MCGEPTSGHAQLGIQTSASPPLEPHLVVSKSARMTLAYGTTMSVDDLTSLADVSYSNTDLGAELDVVRRWGDGSRTRST